MSHNQYIRHVPNAKLGVLFIHGFLGSPKHFNDFISSVPENIAVYNILLDGHNADVMAFGRASMTKWKKQIDEAAAEMISLYNNIIIVGHSMGTFFAMEQAIKYPQNVKSIMLLQSPLKIALKPSAMVYTFKSFFKKFSDDPIIKTYRDSHSVKLNLRIWEYSRWIPRYLELFSESKKSRENILKLTIPTYVFQSRKDELVSIGSLFYIPNRSNIKLTVLENSAHFIYDESDFSIMLDAFLKLL